MREKGREERDPKAHLKNSDFGTPYNLGTLYWPNTPDHQTLLTIGDKNITYLTSTPDELLLVIPCVSSCLWGNHI